MYLWCWNTLNLLNLLLCPSLQDRSDWLLDSALGRWLTSRQFVFSNLTLLKVLLWLVLLGLFAELEFGLPFFIISLFYWLYEGLRSPAAREPGELSAYSVFNPDCQPLLGSLTAEQLEGEMGYRPLANRWIACDLNYIKQITSFCLFRNVNFIQEYAGYNIKLNLLFLYNTLNWVWPTYSFIPVPVSSLKQFLTYCMLCHLVHNILLGDIFLMYDYRIFKSVILNLYFHFLYWLTWVW